jgi:hypothetical protein
MRNRFLVGFILEYSNARKAQQQSQSATTQLESCQFSVQLSDIRDKAALAYMEATQKNYGTAGQYASQFFDLAQRTATSTQNEGVRNTLHQLLSSRDKITTELAQGNAAATGDLQMVLSTVEQNLKQ